MKWLNHETALSIVLVIIIVCFSFTPAMGLDRDAAFRYPVRAYNDGNYRVAIRGFNQFLGEYSDDPRVTKIKFWKAEAHFQLEDYRKAFNQLKSLHENNPNFKQGQILRRIGFLADKLGLEQQAMKLFNTRLLGKEPRLQNYLVKWRLDRKQPQELFSELSLVEEDKLTKTAREFLRNHSRSQTVESVEDKLYSGQWSGEVREQLNELPEVTRKNILTLGVKNIWDKESYKALVNFAEEVPEPWQTPEFKLYYAEAATKTGQLRKAEQIYRDILNQSKYRAQAHFSLAWVLYERHKASEAEKFLKKIDWEKIDESFSAEAVRLLGDIHIDRGSPGKATSSYQRSMELSEDPSFRNQTRYWLAWALYETGEVRRAHKLFNNISAEGDIVLSDVYQARGRTSLEIGQYDQAIKNYNKALKFSNESERTNTLEYELAQALYEQGKMQEAFDHLIELSGKELSSQLETSVNMALGRSALEIGEHDLAWSLYRNNKTALRRQFPKEYLYFAGQSALEVNQLERASILFDELLKNYPNSPFGRSAVRMSFRVDLKRTELSDTEQRRKLRKTIEQSPPDMRLSLIREWADHANQQGDYSRARALYEEIMFKATDPSVKGKAIDRIVKIQLENNMIEQAFQFIDERFAELPVHPRASRAVYRLIRHDYQNRNHDRLKKWTREYFNHFDSSPYHGHIYFMLGEIDRKNDNKAKAKSHYTRSLQNEPSESVSIRANYRLGELLYGEQQYEQSLEFLTDVREEDADFISPDRLKTMLGNAYFETSQLNKAMSTLKTKSRLIDRDRLILAKIHFKKKEILEAENYINQITTQERSILRAEKRFLEGRIELNKGNRKEAENIWYETLYLFSDWNNLDKLIYHLSELLEKQGKQSESNKLRERLKEDFPNSKYLEEI